MTPFGIEPERMSDPTIATLLDLSRQSGCGSRKGSVMKYLVSHDSRQYALYRTLFPWQAAALENMLVLAAARGVPVQPVETVHEKHRLGLSHPGSWVICHYVQGEPLIGKATETQINALGKALAGLHSIESSRPRRLMGMFTPPFSFHLRLKMELRLLCSRFTPSLLGKNEKLRSWIGYHADTFGRLPVYQLTLGDLYGRNVIVTETSAALIDYELARFEPCGFELATALQRSFCVQRTNLQFALLESYLNHCSTHTASLWNNHYPFFFLVAAMRLYAGRIRRIKMLTMRAQDAGQQQEKAISYRRWVFNIANIIRAHHNHHPSIEDLLACCD